MLNHFLMFASEDAARSALAAHVVDENWNASYVIPGQRVVLARSTWNFSNPEHPVEMTPEQTVPGFFITVTLPSIDPALRDLPGNACRLIGESDTGEIVYTAPDLDPGLLATAIIEPMPAGAAYDFSAFGA